MSKKLQQIRKKIDSLDNKIHDVLMERAQLIDDIAAEKRKNNLQFVHPAREAQMIRRLLDRHTGSLPPAAIVRIWRELVGAVSLMQTGLKISVVHAPEQPDIWDISKNYFGSVVSMQRLPTPLAAIGSVREGESSFAVLPWPEDHVQNAWWHTLETNPDHQIKIVCALPYGAQTDLSLHASHKALVIAKIDFTPSGKDRSFLSISLNQDISRARILETLKEENFEPLTIYTQAKGLETGMISHLVEVKDHLDQQDERLETLNKAFETSQGDGFKGVFTALGGYPVPPVYDSKNV